MNIFRFEMKQYKSSIIVWGLSLSLLIFFTMQMFASMLPGDTTSIAKSLEGNPMMEALGMSVEHFFSPLGMYGYLNSFFMLACAIHAVNLGLSIITKEHMQNTADFLMTKPYSRRQICHSKIAAALCSELIIAAAYLILSLAAVGIAAGGSFSIGTFLLLYLMFPLVQILFLMLGIMIGILVSRIGATMPVSMGIAFSLYVVGMYSGVVGSSFARCFSPFKYFNNNYIMANTSYESGYLLLYIILLVIFTGVGYARYMKKDIKMVL